MLYKVIIKRSKRNLRLFCRRDKEFCHECRFCCTLLMCTLKDGTVKKKSKIVLHRKLDEHYFDAIVGYNNDQRMYKQYDYRCLKPVKNQPPEKWPYYEMHKFRAAKTEKEVKEVKEIKYDKNFFNFEVRANNLSN